MVQGLIGKKLGMTHLYKEGEEVVVTAIQRPSSFLPEVPYITSPGARVKTLVSTMGVFEKPEGGDEFVLTGLFPNPEREGEEETVRHIKTHCGWDLKVTGTPRWIETPSLEELRLLRIFDLNRNFLGKL